MKNKVLTPEVLYQLGFDNNHPERLLGKFHKKSTDNPEWNITLESEYIAGSNDLAYNVNAWKCNDAGYITKRSQTGFIKTIDELNKILDICDIPLVG